MGEVGRALTNKGWSVITEQCVPYGQTYLKPDLIAARHGDVWVLDPNIVADGFPQAVSHRTKRQLYDNAPVRTYTANIGRERGSPDPMVSVDGLVVMWYGNWSRVSCRLLNNMGVPRSTLQYITVQLLNEG